MVLCQNGPFGQENRARSVESPNGNAHEAWEKSVSTYEPDNMASVFALSSMRTKSTLGENKNPDIWYVELDRIRERLNHTNSPISDCAFVAHMINNLPDSYKSLIVGRFSIARSALKIEEEVKVDIRDYFDLYACDDGKTNKKGEQAFVLNVPAFQPKFRCRVKEIILIQRTQSHTSYK